MGESCRHTFDGSNVIIRKTKLYHFYPDQTKKNFPIFTQQLANTPCGDTTKVPGEAESDTKETQIWFIFDFLIIEFFAFAVCI